MLIFSVPASARAVTTLAQTGESASAKMGEHSPSAGLCPELTSRQTWNLSGLVQLALCRNPLTAEGWANVDRHRARVTEAGSEYLPKLQASYSQSRGHGKTSIDDDRYADYAVNTKPTSSALSLSWLLFDFGARDAHKDYEEILLDVALDSYRESVSQVVINTADAYYSLLLAHNLARVSHEALDSLELSVAIGKERFALGAGSKAELLEAIAARDSMQLHVLQDDAGAVMAMGRLAFALGFKPSVNVKVEQTELVAPSILKLNNLQDYLLAAQNEHPLLRSARGRLAAAEANTRSAGAQGKPTLVFFANIQYNESISSGNAYTYSYLSNSAGLTLNIPIFDGFSARSQRARAAAEVDVAQAQLHGVENQVELDVWTYFQEVLASLQKVSLSRSSLLSSQQAVQVAYGRYKSGMGSLLDLLNSQNRLMNTKLQQAQAVAQLRLFSIRLALAAGQAVEPLLINQPAG
ncbi:MULTISPECIES: TolC family protein [unclassified Pseudomonas]|uniref:TolC family protein n=1 Tax=unclassified Pseudomonas TaxID=196821 RepID=UPI00130481B0|nr:MULTISPECIES: TolC family protein [unclassified Pseudomonas]